MPTRFTGSGLVRRPAVSERQSDLDTFCARLVAIGATDDEVAAVRESWPTADADERAFARNVTDVDLRVELARVRSEYVEHTTEGGPVTDGATEPGPLSLPDELQGQPRVADVLAWVGDDVDRAQLALEAEWTRATQRVTLIEALQARLDAAAD